MLEGCSDAAGQAKSSIDVHISCQWATGQILCDLLFL